MNESIHRAVFILPFVGLFAKTGFDLYVCQVQGEFNIAAVTSQLEPQDHPAPVVSS